MPTRASRVCPRCLTPLIGRRCQVCADRRRHAYDLRTADRPDPYQDPAWVRLSRAYRRVHPLCEGPKCAEKPEYRRALSAVVDHIDGLGPAGPLGLDERNLMALCRPCHNAKTNSHDGGWGNKIKRISLPSTIVDNGEGG